MASAIINGLLRDTVTGALIVNSLADPTNGGVVLPLHGYYVPSTSNVLTINRLNVVRAVAPASGFLRDVSFFVAVQSGNCIVSAFDCGLATPAVYTALGNSGSVPVAAANGWQTWDPGAGVIPVVQGQQLGLGIMADNVTAAFGRNTSGVTGGMLYPPNFFTAAALAKLSWIRDVGSFTTPATINEGNALITLLSFVAIARISDT